MVRSACVYLCNTLHTLGQVKLFHGDLRPDNIVLNISNPDQLKLIDFGSSCIGSDSGEFG